MNLNCLFIFVAQYAHILHLHFYTTTETQPDQWPYKRKEGPMKDQNGLEIKRHLKKTFTSFSTHEKEF